MNSNRVFAMIRWSTNKGFTLIEIAVVVMLIGIMLVFTVPRLPDDLLTDPVKKTSRWLILNVQNLKERSVRERKNHTLHIDVDTEKFWITNETMSDEEQQTAAGQGFELPVGLKIMDVEYPDDEKIISGQAAVTFYQKGYSDRALIHIEADSDRFTYQIEPFLSKLRYHEAYIGFDN